MADESDRRMTGEGGALRRMVRRPAVAPAPAADPGGLRAVAPRIVDRVAGLAVRPGAPSVALVSRDDLGAAMPEGALTLGLEGGEAAPGGLAWLGPDLFAGLVERRLTGALRTAPPAARPATPLDAVICRELVDALCAEPGVLGRPQVRTGAHLRNPDLSVALPDMPFRLVRIRLGLGREGERGGEIALALPEAPAPEAPPPASRAPRPELGGCRAELDAALEPVSLTWARVTALEPGEVLMLPEGAIDGLILAGIDGAPVAAGRLGRLGGSRAVRLAVAALPAEEVAPPYEELSPEP